MDKILAMREKRAALWEQAKVFLDEHTQEGSLSAEDAKAYEQMENEVLALGRDIERMERQAILDAELSRPVGQPITNMPGASLDKDKQGRASDSCRAAMLKALRTNFRQVENVLQEGTDASGGYLVPEEYDKRLIDVLSEENVPLRRRSRRAESTRSTSRPRSPQHRGSRKAHRSLSATQLSTRLSSTRTSCMLRSRSRRNCSTTTPSTSKATSSSSSARRLAMPKRMPSSMATACISRRDFLPRGRLPSPQQRQTSRRTNL